MEDSRELGVTEEGIVRTDQGKSVGRYTAETTQGRIGFRGVDTDTEQIVRPEHQLIIVRCADKIGTRKGSSVTGQHPRGGLCGTAPNGQQT